MRRLTRPARPGWRDIVESQGLGYAVTLNAQGEIYDYWDETAYYEFSLTEVEALETVVANLHEMCLVAAEHVIATGRLHDYGIHDQHVVDMITRSWRERDRAPSVYGRFDLRYDGSGPAKLLEYNADTPTSLVEAAGPQWFWLEELFPDADQWNSLHERLVDAWRAQAPLLPPGPLHLAYSQADTLGEDYLTVAYLQECAEQAGLHTVLLAMEEIGWDPAGERFIDLQNRTIKAIFKLYPWEWLTADKFGAHAVQAAHGPIWIEPPWKMLLSNKALLAILWELFPGHPNLLPAYLDGPRELAPTGYVAKPLLGREGSGVRIVTPGGEVSLPVPDGGPVYGAEGFCYQAFYPLPEFGGRRPVLGAWVVDGESAGLGIREAEGLITDQGARFVPHLIA